MLKLELLKLLVLPHHIEIPDCNLWPKSSRNCSSRWELDCQFQREGTRVRLSTFENPLPRYSQELGLLCLREELWFPRTPFQGYFRKSAAACLFVAWVILRCLFRVLLYGVKPIFLTSVTFLCASQRPVLGADLTAEALTQALSISNQSELLQCYVQQNMNTGQKTLTFISFFFPQSLWGHQWPFLQ